MIEKRKKNKGFITMKITKKLLLFITVLFIASAPFAAYAETDCSDPKGFHAKAVCKLKGLSSGSGSTKTKKSSDSSLKKNTGSIWQKIKNFGGKNVGEPG